MTSRTPRQLQGEAGDSLKHCPGVGFGAAAWTRGQLAVSRLREPHTLFQGSLARVALFLRNLDLRGILKLTSPFNLGNRMKWMASSSVPVLTNGFRAQEGGTGFHCLASQDPCKGIQDLRFVLSSQITNRNS